MRLIAAEHPEYGAPAIYGRLGAMEWPSKNDGPPSIPTVTRILREFRGEDALTQRLYAPASWPGSFLPDERGTPPPLPWEAGAAFAELARRKAVLDGLGVFERIGANPLTNAMVLWHWRLTLFVPSLPAADRLNLAKVMAAIDGGVLPRDATQAVLAIALTEDADEREKLITGLMVAEFNEYLAREGVRRRDAANGPDDYETLEGGTEQ